MLWNKHVPKKVEVKNVYRSLASLSGHRWGERDCTQLANMLALIKTELGTEMVGEGTLGSICAACARCGLLFQRAYP